MKVLSLFDGIATGRLALEKAGFDIERYVAFEIDKQAIQIALKNFPDIEERGSVVGADFTEFKGFDLIIFGSPCQDLSSMNRNGKGLDGENSGLFFEAVRAIKEVEPKYFLMENVASMSKKDRNRISEILGVEPIMIDSKLLSAQGRRRLYWTNIPNVEQPENKGLVMKDIFNPTDEFIYEADWEPFEENKRFVGEMKKSWFSESRRLLNVDFPAPCITTGGRHFYFWNGKIYRFSPLECERLQTLPDGYTEGISKTARYRALGNGWTCDIISHIVKNISF